MPACPRQHCQGASKAGTTLANGRCEDPSARPQIQPRTARRRARNGSDRGAWPLRGYDRWDCRRGACACGGADATATPRRRSRRSRPAWKARTASSVSSRPHPIIASLKPLRRNRSSHQNAMLQLLIPRCRLARSGEQARQCRKSHGMPSSVDAATEKLGERGTLSQHVIGRTRIGEHARTLSKTATPRKRPVIGNEVPFGHHVTVEQDDVTALGSGDRAIARATHPRTVIRLPQMHQPHRIVVRQAQQQLARGRLRAIVRDDDFVRQLGLIGERAQYQLKCLGPVVGDHGDTDAHGLPPADDSCRILLTGLPAAIGRIPSRVPSRPTVHARRLDDRRSP